MKMDNKIFQDPTATTVTRDKNRLSWEVTGIATVYTICIVLGIVAWFSI